MLLRSLRSKYVGMCIWWHVSKQICLIMCVTSGWESGFLLFLLAARREGTFALNRSIVWAATRQHGGESTRSRTNTDNSRIQEKRLHSKLQPGTNKFLKKRHGFVTDFSGFSLDVLTDKIQNAFRFRYCQYWYPLSYNGLQNSIWQHWTRRVFVT